MLALDSKRWCELSDAYGAASAIPALLRELEPLPPDDHSEAEPYFSLWSALCHQGDIYTASYAALPHLVRVMEASPDRVPWTMFQMVACIELARLNGKGPDLPHDLQADYRKALDRVPALVAATAKAPWDELYCRATLCAIAASKGLRKFAEAISELDPETVADLMRRKFGE